MIISLVLMLFAFIGIYIYFSKRFDKSELSGELFGRRKMSDKLHNDKFELEKKRAKKDFIKVFKKISTEEQIALIHELQVIHETDEKDSSPAA